MIIAVFVILVVVSITSLYLTMSSAYEYGTLEYTINMVAGIGSDITLLIMIFLLS